jgi:hypothetical protein
MNDKRKPHDDKKSDHGHGHFTSITFVFFCNFLRPRNRLVSVFFAKKEPLDYKCSLYLSIYKKKITARFCILVVQTPIKLQMSTEITKTTMTVLFMFIPPPHMYKDESKIKLTRNGEFTYFFLPIQIFVTFS